MDLEHEVAAVLVGAVEDVTLLADAYLRGDAGDDLAVVQRVECQVVVAKVGQAVAVVWCDQTFIKQAFYELIIVHKVKLI